MLRSRRAPRSAAISCSPAAAAAAPRSRRLLPSRAPQPVPRCRLGSGGRRRSSSPARPGPRGPSRWRGDSGAPPSCRGAEKEESGEGDQYIPGRGGVRWVGLQVPGAATRRRLRLRLHTPARGGRRPRGWGAGAPGAHPRARARAPPSPAPPRLRRGPPPLQSQQPPGRPRRRARSPPPSPRSRGRERGARRSCCWRQGNPGEADPPPAPRGRAFGAAPRPPLTSRTPPVAET